MKYSLIQVCTEENGKVDGTWLQDHHGTLKSAAEAARETERANSGRISVAVVEFIGSTGFPNYEVMRCLKRLDTETLLAKLNIVRKPEKINASRYSQEENDLLDWAIETVVEKYLLAGGNEENLMSWEQLDCAFCGMLYREGAQAVRDFVNNYKYIPSLNDKMRRGYA